MRIVDLSFAPVYAPPNADVMRVLEHMARKAYKSEDLIGPGTADRLIRKLLDQKPTPHESVIEHMGFSIEVICDRGVSHEIVRQRLCSFTQESTRFCNYSKGKFGSEITLCPMLEGLTEAQIDRRMELYRHVEQVYLDEIREGIAPQQARDNLLTCQKTDIGVTANMRQWRRVLVTRTPKNAHPQMRKLMRKVLVWARDTYPVIFDGVGDLHD